MTNQPESGSTPSGQQAGQPANPDAQNVEQTSPQAPLFTPEQEAFIADLVKRTDQSAKDRAVNRIEKTVQQQQDQLDRFADLLKNGMTPDQAKRELAIDQLLNQGRTLPAASDVATTNATSQPAPESVDFMGIYAAAGMDPNDNEVVGLTVKHGHDANALRVELLKLKERRLANPPANAGSVSPASSGAAPSTQTKEASLQREMAELMKNPMANQKRINEIGTELRSLSQ